MSLHPPSRYAWGSLGALAALALVLIWGVSATLQGAVALSERALPQPLVDACLLFLEETGGPVWGFVAARPLSALAGGLVVSSFGWAALRLAAALLVNHRVARRFSRVTGQVPALDRALRHLPQVSRGRLRLLPSDAGQAFTLGIWRPRIFLTAGLIDSLSEEELRAVLLHEAAHLKARDPFRLAVVRFLTDALWFIPLARTLRETFLRMAELEADQTALTAGGEAVELASAIVKTAQAKVGPVPAVSPALDSPSFLEERVERLLGLRQEVSVGFPWRRTLASGGVVAALVLFLFGAGEIPASPPPAVTMGARPMMTMPMMPGCEPVMCREMRGRLF